MNSSAQLRTLKSLLTEVSPEARLKVEQLPLSTLISILFAAEKELNSFVVAVEALGLGEMRWNAYPANGQRR